MSTSESRSPAFSRRCSRRTLTATFISTSRLARRSHTSLMNVTGECTLSASREAVFDKLADPFFFASCFDGVSGLTENEPGRYDAVLETTVAYMKFRFKMQVEMVRLARPEIIEAKIEGTPAGIVGRLAATTLT